ncbi:glycosyltransferase family 50 protein, partial [Aureobasidium melanogenum]
MSQTISGEPGGPASKKSSTITNLFSNTRLILSISLLLRAALLLWGEYQDANSPLKYTDIDYLVFTDASRYVYHNQSPYLRDTYRYTPLLAWLLYPTAYGGRWFCFGKAVFAVGDIVTGYLIFLLLQRQNMDKGKATGFASIWLLNPMVANISTRGSSEGLLAVIVVGVHFKIYPFVYAVSMVWWLDRRQAGSWDGRGGMFGGLVNRKRVQLALFSFITFAGLNMLMFRLYGIEFIRHSYTYHLTRIDHRHNFSVYNTLLHMKSALGSSSGLGVESLAFFPQLFLSVIAIPLLLAKKDLAGTMLAQTFAFVTFNKVCTSQYFLWYMVFLPFYLPNSSLLRRPKLGYSALALWVLGQALWLQQGYELEFLGKSTFVPGLWVASMLFFGINCWILGIVVSDINAQPSSTSAALSAKKAE